jgi:hypothetical protein
MGKSIKESNVSLTDELVKSFIGKYIHVATNMHQGIDDRSGLPKEVNVWFAGRAIGFSKEVVFYNFETDTMLDIPVVTYTMLMADGMGYMLSNTLCEIDELTKDEYTDMVEAFKKQEEAKSKIILPN